MQARRLVRSVVPAVFALAAACSRSHAQSVATPAGPSATVPVVVTAPARNAIIAAGESVPAFRALTHDGRVVSVAAGERPRALVLYFYPRDATPG